MLLLVEETAALNETRCSLTEYWINFLDSKSQQFCLCLQKKKKGALKRV